VTLEGRSNFLVLGVVVGVHIRDDVLTGEGRVDVTRFRPLSRLGYMDYAAVGETFEMTRPEV
jgi:flavin reductase (DIM6/NTAB) family NADH-FMN oxidoreductase RutF